jgi:hypothetical protein
MMSDKFAGAVHEVLPSAEVKLLHGIDHMAVLSTPGAVNAITGDVATRGTAATSGASS